MTTRHARPVSVEFSPVTVASTSINNRPIGNGVVLTRHARESLEHNSRALTSREIDLHVFHSTNAKGILQQEIEIRIFGPKTKALKRNHTESLIEPVILNQIH